MTSLSLQMNNVNRPFLKYKIMVHCGVASVTTTPYLALEHKEMLVLNLDHNAMHNAISEKTYGIDCIRKSSENEIV